MNSNIFIDGISNVSIANGVLRVDCVAIGPNNEQRMSGTLHIPASQAGPIVQGLANALQELQRKQVEQIPTSGNA